MANAPGTRMSFDTLAPHYRWMEPLLAGEKLQRCRVAFLAHVTTAKRILIVGEGHGRFLVECRRALPAAQITCVDASQRMLAIARSRLANAGLGSERVTFLHADVLAWNPPAGVADLLVTHFFLDCFRPEQLRLLIAQLAQAAQPHAAWLLSDFQVPPAGLPRLRARLILKAMYVFFRVATRLPAGKLSCPDDLIRNQGFELRHRHQSEWGLLRSDFWERNPDYASN